MDGRDAARELLYGVTAVRLGLLDRGALAGALAVWKGSGGGGLADVLARSGRVPRDRLRGVDAAVAEALEAHGGDARRALEAAGPVAARLVGLLDVDEFSTLNDHGPAGGATPRDRGEDTLRDGGGPATAAASAAPTATNFDTFAPVTEEARPAGPAPDATAGRGESTAPAARAADAAGDATEAAAGPGPSDTGPGLADTGPGPSDTPSWGGGPAAGPAGAAGLPRYRVLRPHARGGLGEVFLALDEELHREVALKEIQGKHADRDDSRLQFLIEAEVTGGLEHPGIVPVYGLGRYPDGRPYYAMRFIRGESMKEAIERFHAADATPGRDPGERALGLRKLLGQLVDVCDAMSYAHSRGVLHRDLKPGNVMLGGFGETLVVDWGLAKFQDAPEPAGPRRGSGVPPLRPSSAGSGSRTVYGTAVGTPAYMSPEQATGELDRLGPASDVYSLGSILYTILTGAAPFREKSYHSLLSKVIRGDFPPPSAAARGVDPALNAICLKAMATDPAGRYPTARALADDLEHWLADEPVSAHREPLLRRLGRWARRHRTAVASAAVLLVTASVSLGVYSVLIRREQARTLAERDRARQFYELARMAVDRMLTKLGEEGLADVPQMELVRRSMLDEARRFYAVLLQKRRGDPGADADAARSSLRLGDVEGLIGEDAKALGHYNEAVEGLKKLRAKGPGDRALTQDLARAFHARGLLHRRMNRDDEAGRDLEEARKLREALSAGARATTDDRRALVETLYHLAALRARRGATAEALEGYGRVLEAQQALAGGADATPDDRRRLGRYRNNLANLLRALAGRRGEALRLYGEALEAQEGVVRERPAVAFYRYELGKTAANLYTLLGGGPAAEPYAERGLALARALAAEFPNVPDYRHELAVAEANVGAALTRRGAYDRAQAALDRAVGLADDLAGRHGDRVDYQAARASALMNRGVLGARTRRLRDAERDGRRAAAILAPLARRPGAPPEHVLSLGICLHNLAEVRRRLEPDDPGGRRRADLDAAKAALGPLVRDHGDLREARRALALTDRDRARDWAEAGEPRKAEADLRDACEALRPLARAEPPDPDDLLDLAVCLTRLGVVRRGLARDDAGPPLDEAVALLEPRVPPDGGRPEDRAALALALFERGTARYGDGSPPRLREAEHDLSRARDVAAPLDTGPDADREHLTVLGNALFYLAGVHRRLGEARRALDDLEAAAAVDGRLGDVRGPDGPPLWRDLAARADLLSKAKDYVASAGAAERLPDLRPDHAGSYRTAARALAFCTFASSLGMRPDDPGFPARCLDYAGRSLKVLERAAGRGLLRLKDLDDPVYNVVRTLPAFRALRDRVQAKERARSDLLRPPTRAEV